MAFYKFNRDLPMGQILRSGLDNLRDGMAKLKRCTDDMAQMTDAQISDIFGVAPTTVGGNDADVQSSGLKAELASDIGKLFTDGSQTNVNAALNQLFAQTG